MLIAGAFQPGCGSLRERATPANLLWVAGSAHVAVSALYPGAVGARQHAASASTARMVGYAPGDGWVDGDGLKTVHAWLPTDEPVTGMLAARRKSLRKKKSKYDAS
jgi:hypothetical protein